jgi:hypothetical protein
MKVSDVKLLEYLCGIHNQMYVDCKFILNFFIIVETRLS